MPTTSISFGKPMNGLAQYEKSSAYRINDINDFNIWIFLTESNL